MRKVKVRLSHGRKMVPCLIGNDTQLRGVATLTSWLPYISPLLPVKYRILRLLGVLLVTPLETSGLVFNPKRVAGAK